MRVNDAGACKDTGEKLTEITKEQLRDFYINYHGFVEFFELDGQSAISHIFERIKSVQYDPLNIIGRNAELAMFSRNKNVTREDLFAALYDRRELVDGWDKMMCIFQSAEFEKFKYVRDESARQYRTVMSRRGQDDCHAATEDIYGYLARNGESSVTDIPSPKTNNGGWGPSKVAGVCCEYLWNSGRITVARKKGVVKSFDTTERLLGKDWQANGFSDFDEFLRWYVKRRVQSVGAACGKNGGAWLGIYVDDKELRERAIAQLVELGELLPIAVEGVKNTYYIPRGAERFLSPSKNERAVFVAPLDNLIWDRASIKSVFDFDYSWEVYAPKVKRKYGYYVLPIIIGNRFVGRIEPVLNKAKTELHVQNIWFEDGYTASADDLQKITDEAKRLASFLNVEADINICV